MHVAIAMSEIYEHPAADVLQSGEVRVTIDQQRERRSLLRKRRTSRLLDASEEMQDEINENEMMMMMTTSHVCILVLSSFILGVGLAFTLKIKEAKALRFGHLSMWKWDVMGLVIILGRLVSRWGVQIILRCMKKTYIERGLKASAANCVWWLMVTTAWLSVVGTVPRFVRNTSYILLYVGKLWWCLLVANIIWLAKRILIEVLASSFQVKTFFDPIQESLLKQYLIEKLSRPPVELGSGGRRPLSQHDLTFDKLQRWNPNNVSSWHMKKLINIVRRVRLSTHDEAITSENQATVAAERIFGNVAKPESEFIDLEDVLRFLSEDEADALKTTFEDEDGSEQSLISRHALTDWVVVAFKQRRAIACSLKDTSTAVNTVHQMMNVAVGTLIIIIWLLILHVPIIRLIVFLSSQIFLGVFFFGNTAKRSFEGIVFLFLRHPFDVGDHVEIDGVEMVVEKMEILDTLFVKCSDGRRISYPNYELASQPIQQLP